MLHRTPRPVATEVSEAFTEVAAHYDTLVRLNPGYHDHLRSSARALVAAVAEQPGALRLLDLGCGSGASTLALVQEVEAAGLSARVSVVGLDASEGMLAAARAKSWPGWVSFRHGRAEDLAEHAERAEGEHLHGVLAAYLVRNVTARDELLSALHAALAPGGSLVLHEYSVSGSRWARAVWTLVCWTVVVPLAAVVARSTRLYRYLWRSVVDFDSVAVLQQRLQRAGFVAIRRRSFGNWQRGILHTFAATRPTTSTHPGRAAAPGSGLGGADR